MKYLFIVVVLLLLLQGLNAEITLNQAIEMATQNNKDLQMAKEDVKIAEYNYKDVRGQLFPQLSLIGSLKMTKNWLPDKVNQEIPKVSKMITQPEDGQEDNYLKNDQIIAGYLDGFIEKQIPSSPTGETSIAGIIQFQQLLFSGGKLINGIRVLDKVKTMQEKRYELQMQQMVLTVVGSFYDLYLAQEGLAIQRQALSTAEMHLERVENLHRQGLVSEYDKLRAELEVSRLYPEVLNFENMKNLAEENFNRIIGNTGEVVLNPTLIDKTANFSSFDITLEKAIESAKEKRVELYLTNLMQEIYEVQRRAERDNWMPNLILQADITRYNAPSPDFEVKSDDFGTMGSVGLVFQMPLFSGLSNSSKSLRSRHELRKSEYENINANEMITLEVRQNWQSFYQSLKYLEIAEKNLELSMRALNIAEARFENQSGIQLEVFDSQIQYNGALMAISQAKIKIIKDYFALNKAIGNNLNKIIGDIQ